MNRDKTFICQQFCPAAYPPQMTRVTQRNDAKTIFLAHILCPVDHMMTQYLTKAVLTINKTQRFGVNQSFICTNRADCSRMDIINIAGNPDNAVAGMATCIRINKVDSNQTGFFIRTASCCKNLCQPGCYFIHSN